MDEKKVDDMSIAGASLTILIDGVEYEKRPLLLGDYSDLEKYIKSGRIQALHMALDDTKPARMLVDGVNVIKNPEYDDWLEQKTTMTIAVAQTAVMGEEVDAAAKTLSGVRFLWNRMLDGNANLPEGGIDTLIRPDNMGEMNALMRADETAPEEDDTAEGGDADSPPVIEQTDG